MIAECNWRLEAISQAAKNRRRDAFVLRAGENRVGKQRDSHIKIASQLCSREHCRIFLDGNKVTLIDTVNILSVSISLIHFEYSQFQ